MKKRMFGIFIGAVLIAVSSFFTVSASNNVSAATLSCEKVHGYLQTQVVAPGETQGTITQGGLLNGSTQDHIANFNETTGTYTATFQDTTEDGTLITQDNGQSFPDGAFIEYGTIDSQASTGRFAHATGSLMFNGATSDGVHFTATVSGTICGTYL